MFDDHALLGGAPLRPESLMMSYGYRPAWSEGAIKPPIFQTSTFVFNNAEEGKSFFELAYGLRPAAPDEQMGLIYSRLNNPGLEILENRLTLWDEAEEAASFASGMAAISTTLLALLAPGDVVLHSEPVYGGSDFFLKNVLRKFGITAVGFRPCATPAELDTLAATLAGRLAMVFVETPANPTNHLVDLEACAALAARYGTAERPVHLVVDNTFLGPVFQQPLRHGADVVLYSATKFLGGHSDLIAGAALSSRAIMKEIKAIRTFLGTMCDPNTGWMLMRSLEILKLRMERAAQSARLIADWLREHPLVARTYYLTHLAHDPAQQDIYRRHCLSPGSMISFDIRGGEPEAFRFLNALRLIKLAVSLGGTESLAEHPATMTHSDIPVPEQAEMGITPQMIRLSIGVEDPQDLMRDLAQAFAVVGVGQEAELAMAQPLFLHHPVSDLTPQQQEDFTTRFYYSCLYNSLVLFAAPPDYLQQLDQPMFDVVFELESEYSYAFEEPVFSENFRRGTVAEALRQDLLLFKQDIELLSNDLWNWEAILAHNSWLKVRLKAEELLRKLGETRRTYDLSFTTIIPG